MAAEARALQRTGIEYVVVSLGGEGALMCGPDNTYHAAAPAVKISSTVGAGDSMVAGLLFAFAHAYAAVDALQFAVACGTGTTLHPGTALFTADEVATLRRDIVVRTLDI